MYKDASAPVAKRVDDLLARMTLEEKIGQMTQPDWRYITEAEMATYHVGSLLAGGGGAPKPNTPESWADMYDRFQKAALADRLGIPMLFGVDAVHGHNNVYGATIFPHNIGLGATRNPELIRQIAAATAAEVAATGIAWDFAPCVAVTRDERWGRSYESFGEHPELACMMTSAVKGYQGESLADPTAVLACAKHFVADGGTRGGKDQGDSVMDEAELRAIHLAPYVDAVEQGVATVMVS